MLTINQIKMRYVTSACLHPDPPQSHFCRPQSPSVSASTSSLVVALLWTLNDLWYQVDRIECWKKGEATELILSREPIISYLASPAACEVPPQHLAAAAPAPASWLWDEHSFNTCKKEKGKADPLCTSKTLNNLEKMCFVWQLKSLIDSSQWQRRHVCGVK